MAIPDVNSMVSEIQAEVNDASGVLATATLLSNAINEGYWKAARRIVGAKVPGHFLQINAVNVTNGTADYNLTAGHIAMDKVELSPDGTNFYEATQMKPHDDKPSRSYSDTEPYWYYYGSQIRVRPTPDADGTAYLRLYEYVIPDRISSTDTPESPLYEAYDILKAYARYRFYKIRGGSGDSNLAREELITFNDELDELISDLMSRSRSTPEMIAVPDESFDGWSTV